jgi:hypothetical protein
MKSTLLATMLLMGSPKSTLGNALVILTADEFCLARLPFRRAAPCLTPSGVLPHLERRLASPRAASCLPLSGVLPHPEWRLASQQTFDSGLAAKPIIDIVVVGAEDQVRFAIARFEPHGFENFGEMGIADRWRLEDPRAAIPNHTYVVERNSPAIMNHITLRQALVEDFEIRNAYAELKKDLATTAIHRDGYPRGKTDFIVEILRRKGVSKQIITMIKISRGQFGSHMSRARPESNACCEARRHSRAGKAPLKGRQGAARRKRKKELAADEFCLPRALGAKGGHADCSIFGIEQGRKIPRLDLEPGVKRCFKSAVDRLFGYR